MVEKKREEKRKTALEKKERESSKERLKERSWMAGIRTKLRRKQILNGTQYGSKTGSIKRNVNRL